MEERDRTEWMKLSQDELLRIFREFRIQSVRDTIPKSLLVDILVKMRIPPFIHFPLLSMEFEPGVTSFAYATPFLYVSDHAGGLKRAHPDPESKNAVFLSRKPVDSVIVNKRRNMMFYLTHEDGAINQVDLKVVEKTDKILRDDLVRKFAYFRRPERFAYDQKHHAFIVEEMDSGPADDDIALARTNPIQLFYFDIRTEESLPIKLDHTVLEVNGMVVDGSGNLYIADGEQHVIFRFEQVQELKQETNAVKRPKAQQYSLSSQQQTKRTHVAYHCAEQIGNGSPIHLKGDYNRCSFNKLSHMTVDERDNWYALDCDNQDTACIRKGNPKSKEVTTLLSGYNSLLRLDRPGTSFTVTEEYTIMVLDDGGRVIEHVPFDMDLVCPFVEIRRAMFSQEDGKLNDIALLVLDYWIPKHWYSYRYTYPRDVFLALAGKTQTKMEIMEKMDAYYERERLSMATLVIDDKSAKKCLCQEGEHVQENKKTEDAKHEGVIRREWYRHTQFFQDQVLELWDALDRTNVEVVTAWILKHHDDKGVCCAQRHYNRDAMIRFPRFSPTEADQLIQGMNSRKSQPPTTIDDEEWDQLKELATLTEKKKKKKKRGSGKRAAKRKHDSTKSSKSVADMPTNTQRTTASVLSKVERDKLKLQRIRDARLKAAVAKLDR